MNNKLKDLKAKSKLTSQQISDLSGVPYSTVCRFFSADQDFQQAQNLADIIKAMGGSLDEFFDFPHKVNPEEVPNELITVYRDMLSEREKLVKEKDKELENLEKELTETKKACKKFLFLSGLCVTVLVLVLLIDLLNGGFGYIRY